MKNFDKENSIFFETLNNKGVTMKSTKFFLSSIVLLVMVLGFTMQAHADLNLIGQGTSGDGTWNLIYDTDLDITWYDYTNSTNTWDNQLLWADGLSVIFGSNTYTDWRLTTTVDGPVVSGYDGTTTAGYNVTTGEMGHLFYTELGNLAYKATDGSYPQPGHGLINTGDFQNLQSATYWTGTVQSTDLDRAWFFNTASGSQSTIPKTYSRMAIAVMDGMAVVPEPISSTLFIIGGATLGFRRFRKKFKK